MEFLTDLYKCDDGWHTHYIEIENRIYSSNINSIIKNKKISIDTLKRNLFLLEDLYGQLDSLYTYAILRYETNIRSNLFQYNIYKVSDLYNIIERKSEEFNNEIVKHKSEILKILSTNKELKYLKAYYNNYFKEDVRTSYEELYSDINIKNYYNDILYSEEFIGEFKFKNATYSITSNNFLEFLNSNSRSIRRLAYTSVVKHFSLKEKEAAFLVNLDYKIKNKNSTIKGYNDYFEEVVSNEIFKTTPNNFLKVSKEIKELFKQTLDIRRKLLGLDYISHYDMYYFGTTNSYISFENAQSIIKDALSIYGGNYLNLLNKIFEENWIHFESSSNKKIGGRSYSSFNSHPYIIINWNNDIDSLYTLIHEVGGAIAQYLAQNSGSILYAELSEMKVEFASVLNELILSDYLMNNEIEYISKEEALFRILEFFKDDYFMPYEYMMVLNNLSNKSRHSILTSEVIEKEYETTIKEFRHFEYFEELSLNKKNWIKDHDQLDLEYNMNYIYAFILVSNFNLSNLSKVFDLYKQGERISDNQFINQIFDQSLEFLELNENSFLRITDFIQKYNK
ncbi:hypothetical protein NGC65_13310 [Staphylococcus xylosus]|uniref:hypothetical protein n=1 Tax=Staphylococcus xylosus TaxID=1288 RepID=UPI002DC018BB|nr:hypothetical protein [Staphylococcus xylosus]MEB7823341.1 hypothetical protein [Staphylococcus xylosus]MEB7866408.1 hypothetical protein [Staphylococcus xylosus]